MKAQNVTSILILGLAGVTFYFNFLKPKASDTVENSGGGGSTYYVSPNADIRAAEPKKSSQIPNTPKEYKSSPKNNFKTSIYKDDYNRSSSSSKKSRKYIENETLNFTVVKEDNKTIGGFDFKKSQSINKKTAKLFEDNKNNPIFHIARGLN